jgi:hypothetical protein
MTYNCTSILSGLPADEMIKCKTLVVLCNMDELHLHLWTLSTVTKIFKIFSSMGVSKSRFREKVPTLWSLSAKAKHFRIPVAGYSRMQNGHYQTLDKVDR